MDMAASTAGVPADEEYVTPALRFFLSDEPAISVENDFLHGLFRDPGPWKEQQAHDDAGVAVPYMRSTHLRTADAAPYSAVVEEFRPTPTKGDDQPSAGVYGILRYQRRPTRRMFGSWSHPALQLRYRFLAQRLEGTATGTLCSAAKAQARDQPASPLPQAAASCHPSSSNDRQADGARSGMPDLGRASSRPCGSGGSGSEYRGRRI